MTPPNHYHYHHHHHHHHSNIMEFSYALEGFSPLSFDPNNHHGAIPLNESTDSLLMLELEKPADTSNQGHATSIRVSSWSNLDFCINVSDIESEPRTETMKDTSTRNVIASGVLLNKDTAVTKQLDTVFPHESNTPALTTQRSACNLSQSHTSLSACESKAFGRNKKHSNLADKIYYKDRQMPMNHLEHSSSKFSETEYNASPKWARSNEKDLYKAKSIPKVSSVQILLSEFDKIMELD